MSSNPPGSKLPLVVGAGVALSAAAMFMMQKDVKAKEGPNSVHDETKDASARTKNVAKTVTEVHALSCHT
ncbi:hypothetical protein CYLTODRAFT_19643 [Cylindrobasidium torrendii FP15055 ss-10]|uniref:Uncharacterized protein n=1 Tax=Cylindrobasidium torrendii FP15055 ss-10 TaxID=1314674 RepID=A0A0D7BRC0_9AGAR|nr:hypothetical protein CYLTODRAFT_19643 [Cylindrobasidium torrendii FP15055 ss-10]